jgi:sulfide:quinone oxidoreductase
MKIVIVGGGVAGLEELLAVRDLAGERVEVTLVSGAPDFVYRPLTVDEPFTHEPAEQRALEPIARELGASFVLASLTRVRSDAHEVDLSNGSTLGYDALVICVGGKPRPAYESAVTFDGARDQLRIDQLIEASRGGTLAFVVPPGVTWPLPIYELALMTDRRARGAGGDSPRFVIVTPEEAPLAVFGDAASKALERILAARGIALHTGTRAHQEDGEIVLVPGGERLDAASVIALPVLDGPAIAGLPRDDGGFLPIDAHARVSGVEDVYAAGDGTNFSIKQGGIATQQADAAAEHIAARAGADLDPQPFRPVLRGKLLVAEESVHLLHDIEAGASNASDDHLWWPPHKISGRYLAPWLSHGAPHEPEAPRRPLDVEIDVPTEWHGEPMALDPDGSRDSDNRRESGTWR